MNTNSDAVFLRRFRRLDSTGLFCRGLGGLLSSLHHDLLLLVLRVRPMSVEKLEQSQLVVVRDSLVELVDGRGNLQPLIKNGSLALENDILWPSDKRAKIHPPGMLAYHEVHQVR